MKRLHTAASAAVPLVSTIDRDAASRDRWDVIVIGAGIAGSLAAFQLARRGRATLLVEQGSLPRSKVCGACLSPGAVADLQKLGLWDRIAAIGGHPLTEFELRSGDARWRVRLDCGHAVSRVALDRTLAAAAIEAGAAYLDRTPVSILPADRADALRHLQCACGTRLAASVVLHCGGLGGPAAPEEPRSGLRPRADSRIGLGTTLGGAACESIKVRASADDLPDEQAPTPGALWMATGPEGYVGAVVTEDGAINVAAAVDRSAVRRTSPAEVCGQILAGCGWTLNDSLAEATFRGTGGLTRFRPRAGHHRILFAGDSAGYVEPFTGEGMAWAIRGALALAPWADNAVSRWHEPLPLLWNDNLNQLLRADRRRCRLVAKALRHTTLVRGTVSLLSHFPSLGRFAVRHIPR